jgi:hypothetical protein
MRERCGGDEGVVEDMFGREHRVSLARWANEDPDRTRIVVSFSVSPDTAHRPPHSRREPDSGPLLGVRLSVMEDGDTSPPMPDGSGRTQGFTLREFRAWLGGDEGTVADPSGKEHRVSVADLADADPDRTHIQVIFYMGEPDQGRVPRDPDTR